ncbi:hypothetical protein JAAARDRAFT_39215 [Jaapia argillacea MUCL 33604]|uniref:Smr domain-containing protein n=1 Tax=Jaapia argillacea MUCL 33604 TaxID=933084 RepID=A0A067PQE3_9AGAM|nr:hypothetical protein JAAARDRAFT_39215 [Jaapia argillacea MUCL 33604]
MGFLESILKALVNAICGDSSAANQSGGDKPPHAQGQGQSQWQGQQQQQYPPQQGPPGAWHQPQAPSPPRWENQQGHYSGQTSPPSHTPHRPSVSQPGSPPHKPGQYVDQNQLNQKNEYYMSLRARANEEGSQMAQSFEDSQAAYKRGDGALAKQLSEKGRQHEREMQRLNKEASEWIFTENNKDSKPGEVDLHGLYVKEAIAFTDRAVQEARQRGDAEIHLIVGKGIHSPGGRAKLEPAIAELMEKNQLIAELDPQNAGVLIVSLDGRQRSRGGPMGADDITRRLRGEGGDGCVIM